MRKWLKSMSAPKQFVIKRSNGQYYQGVPHSPEEGCVLLYTDHRHEAKSYSEYEKENTILLMKGEVWEELHP